MNLWVVRRANPWHLPFQMPSKKSSRSALDSLLVHFTLRQGRASTGRTADSTIRRRDVFARIPPVSLSVPVLQNASTTSRLVFASSVPCASFTILRSESLLVFVWDGQKDRHPPVGLVGACFPAPTHGDAACAPFMDREDRWSIRSSSVHRRVGGSAHRVRIEFGREDHEVGFASRRRWKTSESWKNPWRM